MTSGLWPQPNLSIIFFVSTNFNINKKQSNRIQYKFILSDVCTFDVNDSNGDLSQMVEMSIECRLILKLVAPYSLYTFTV